MGAICYKEKQNARSAWWRGLPMADTTWSLTARYIFPVDGAPLPHGIVTIDGNHIASVEPHSKRRADVDLGNVAVVPGFVNAHTHLDLTGLRGKCPPTPDFTHVLRGVIAHRRGQTQEQTNADIGVGVRESIEAGTTLLGDIAAFGHSWHFLARAPLRACVFYEVVGLPKERADAAWQNFCLWREVVGGSPTWRPGVSPHAPYSVHRSLFAPAVWQNAAVTIHLAETRAELELLAQHRGPFLAFLQELGVWAAEGLAESPEQILEWTRGPNPVLYAHCNYLRADAPVPPNAAIVYCPRTHAAFGHAPHPFREFLQRGVRVALGTDSLASNPDLDVLAEARFLHQKYPDFDGPTLLRMATLSGAEALGWADETGSLTPGKSADLAVVPLPDEEAADPHLLLWAPAAGARQTMFRGQWVVPAVCVGDALI
jgi:cytosine/adenosine deaminase-related metal-dependent hydrolase